MLDVNICGLFWVRKRLETALGRPVLGRFSHPESFTVFLPVREQRIGQFITAFDNKQMTSSRKDRQKKVKVLKMIARIAIAAIVLAAALGWADPGVWSGAHQPVNHIEQVFHHETEQSTATISIQSMANAAIAQTPANQTADFIANADLKSKLGAK